MFGNKTVVDMVNRSAENETDRRSFLRAAGIAGLGVVGAAAYWVPVAPPPWRLVLPAMAQC
jgi:hypothetical protein